MHIYWFSELIPGSALRAHSKQGSVDHLRWLLHERLYSVSTPIFTFCIWYLYLLFTISFVFSPLGDIPVVPLTFVKITLQSPFNKDIVEGCIKETLQLLSRSLSMQKHIKFTFKGIGILTIKDDKVKMKFFKEFLYGMDDSGSLVKTLVNVNQCFYYKHFTFITSNHL